MSKFRSAIVWLVLYTQVWTPVLAQTLPISVDRNAPGQRPVVGVTNGVPVVNIAPPSAGGVSNNKFTDFNVGRSGVVLNNSGGASQTQLAGQIAGNPMLGNQRATTILNQVTAPNPSQLAGALEVAGNRANVIVANPAGITCNGCGFLNADRATLTTGKPAVGPDGSIGLDVASGKIRVEGDGLLGGNVGQVDLMARTLEINAGIWAQRLNVTAGASRVDYGSGAVSAREGEGAAPAVALDTAALGGMYANSIRLIGTEAGVGVNVGGNLVALTGDLEVSAAGDLRLTPSGTVQAAKNLQMAAGRDLEVAGAAQASGTVALQAGGLAAIRGAVSAGGELAVNAQGDVTVGAQGSLQTQDALRMAAGRDLALSGSLLMGDQDLSAQAGRHVRAGVATRVPDPVPPVTGGSDSGGDPATDAGSGTGSGSGQDGNPPPAKSGETAAGDGSAGLVSAKGTVTLQAGRDIQLPGRVVASRELQLQAGGELSSAAGAKLQSGKTMSLRAGEDVSLAGSALTDGALSIDSARGLKVDGSALAYGGTLQMRSGGDIQLGAASKTQGRVVDAVASRDLRAGGTMAAAGDVRLQAGRDTAVSAAIGADGDLTLEARGGMQVSGQLASTGKARLQAGGDAALTGSVRSNGDLDVRADGKLSLDGTAGATAGALRLASAGDLSIGAGGVAQAGGLADLRTGAAFRSAGEVSSVQALTVAAAGDAAVDGKLLAGGPLSVDSIGKLVAGAGSILQSEGAMQLRAGRELTLAGVAETNAGLAFQAGQGMRIDGNALAYGGTLSLAAGGDLLLGAASRTQGVGIAARADGDLTAAGAMGSRADIALTAGRDISLAGKGSTAGNLDLRAARDLRGNTQAQWEVEGGVAGQAGQDLALAGALQSNGGIELIAARHATVDGTLTAATGALRLAAGSDLAIGAQGRVAAKGRVEALAGGDLLVSGALSSLDELSAQAVRNATVSGKLYAAGPLDLRARADLALSQGGHVQSDRTLRLNAGQDLTLAGTTLTDGGMTLEAVRDLRVTGDALAFGDRLRASAGRDLSLGAASRLQGKGVSLDAARDARADGTLVSTADAALTAGGDVAAQGTISADGRLDLTAGGTAQIAATGRIESADVARLSAGGDVTMAGELRGNQGASLQAAGDLKLDGVAASAQGELALRAGRDMAFGAGSQALAGGALSALAGASLTAAGIVSSLADVALDAAADLTLKGQTLAVGDLRLRTDGTLASTSDARIQADGSVVADAATAALAGQWIAGRSADLRTRGDLKVDGSVLARDGALSAVSGGDLALGAAGALQAGGLLEARSGAKLILDGTLSGEKDIRLTATTDALLNGKTIANGLLNVTAGGDLRVGKDGLAQGSRSLMLDAGQDLHIAGTAGTADGAGSGGTLRAQAGRDLFVTGVVTGGTPASLAARRHIGIDGTVTALSGGLTADAGGDLEVAAGGRMQAATDLSLLAAGDVEADGTLAAGGALMLQAGGDARLGGVVAALGETATSKAGDMSVLAGRDLIVKQGAQVQAAGALNALAGRDLFVAGALASVRDLALAAARDARVEGSVASDANLTMTGRNIVVGANGLVQAANKLAATADELLDVAGRMLAGREQALTAGDRVKIDGTVAALQGDLSLQAARGDLTLGAGSQVQAGGVLVAAAGGTLQTLGSASAGRGLTLRAAKDALLGGIIATQAGALSASAAGDLRIAADGRLQSAAALILDAGGKLANAGVAVAATNATLTAGSSLANTGAVLAGGDLDVRTQGLLDNAGRLAAGVGADGVLNQPGSLRLTAGSIQHAGASLAGKDMTLTATGSGAAAGDMSLAGGTLSANNLMTLSAKGDIDTAGATLHGGGLDLSAANLRNAGGKITSAGDARIDLGAGGTLDNTGGLIAAAGNARINAGTLDNRDGTVAGGDLNVTVADTLNNQRGLIQADRTLTLLASRLDNRDTLNGTGTSARGVLGKIVSIVADGVDNRGGAVNAGESLAIKTREVDNTAGEVVSQGDARIETDTLKNVQGKVLAGKSLAVIVKTLEGLGVVESAGDLSFEYAGALNQSGDIIAGRDLNLAVGGAMDNSARLSAGRDLNIKADSLHNQATGELLAGRNNNLNVTNGLTNEGLIDGGVTNIRAGSLNNLGRIFGDAISIGAGTLVNDVGAGGGAVIASRGDLDLGATNLVNREHALIYAAKDLRIGGALDAIGRAVGQAVSLINASATIEAAGDARISAASLINRNDHYANETVVVSSKPKVYFTPEGTTDMYDAETNWLCDEVTPMCSKDPAWLNDDPERKLLLPSTKYPADRYGPPFDYVPRTKGKAGRDVPIPPAYAKAYDVCSGGDNGGDCTQVPEKFKYANDARVWAVFGVTPPAGDMPVWREPDRPCMTRAECTAESERRKAHDEAYAAYKARHLELDARIHEFNADHANRLVGNFTYYQVTETVTESRTTSTDPARILSGGNMTLTGAVTNDKSQIAAGGALSISGPEINNIGAGGTRTITRNGTATVTQERRRDRKEYSTPYTVTLAAQPIELPIATAGGNVQVGLSGKTPGSTAIGKPGAVQVASLDLPGGKAVRTVSNPASIPDSQLFTINGRPDAQYIVSTDPRFTGQRPYVSSDYLFDLLRQPGALPGTSIDNTAGAGAGLTGDRKQGDNPSGGVNANTGADGHVSGGSSGTGVAAGGALTGSRLGGWAALIPPGAKFLTPSGQPRRLGDGFYEQKAVSDQILATTGQRFLENYSDNDAQYKALLAAGAKFALDNGVKLGSALTEAQQRQLTTDLVWLVEQTVTLPDGSTETVLVPQVYLVVREGDLKGDGTLMAGRDVKIAAEGKVTNSGTIGSRQATVVTAGNIVNQAGGTIQGGSVNLAAREDLANIASLIKGDKVALTAGRDIALTSTAGSENHGSTWGTHLTGVARVEAGTLDMQAGRDLTLTAAQVMVKDDARLQAGRDITLATLTESHGESMALNRRNRHDLSTSKEIGSVIDAGRNLTLIAGQDVNARAADVTAGKQLAVAAGRDINLTAGVETGSARDEVHYKTKGFLSSKTTHTIKSGDWTQAQGSTFTGDTAVLMAGRDLNVIGSNVGAQKNLVMNAERDVNILPGVNTTDSYDYKKVTKSGLGATGGLSYGKRQQTDSLDGKKVFHTASTVGSVEGDVLINAGKTLNIVGSNVVAPKGDVTLIGQQVNIAAAQDSAREREFHEVKQSGLSINAKNPLLDAMQTANRMGNAAGKTDNKIMKALALVTTGVAAVNTYDEVMKDPQSAGGVTLSLDIGSSKSQTTTTRNTTSSVGSNVAAGNDLTVIAKGAGADSDITVTGSRLSAGNNALLKADGDILLQAARDTYEQHTQNKSSGASVGVGVTAGSNGVGFVATAGANASRGRSDGKDTTWTNTELTAGNVLALQSGGDTSLIGATGRADQIIADVGRDLRIESLQDVSTYDSKQQGGGVQGSLCYGYCKSSVSGNVSQTRMKSDYKSVEEQSGLMAGDGGFVVDVKRNTTLIGGVISSSDQAVADGLNLLKTGTLVAEDVKNVARYKADRISVSGGSGGAGTPVALGAFGENDSKTLSGISGGTVEIRDVAGQQALTGKRATETIALLNRDTSDTLNSLNPIFDKDQIEAGFDIVEEMGKQAGQFFENRAAKAKALEEALKNEPEGPRRDELKAQYEDAKKWEAGGDSRRWFTAIAGAVSGNVTGAVTEMVQAVAVNYLQGLAATEVKKFISNLGDGPQAEAARAALHAIVGCAGAAAKGNDCGAGALGAGAGSVLNALLGETSKLNPEEKEQRSNLIQSLVAGMSKVAGVDGAEAVFAANNETTNNRLAVDEHQSRLAEMEACGTTKCRDEVTAKYREISTQRGRELQECGVDCVEIAHELTQRLAESTQRQGELVEKSRSAQGLSTAELEELEILRFGMPLLVADRFTAIKRGMERGSEEAKQLFWESLAEEGIQGAAAGAGAIGGRAAKGGKDGSTTESGKGGGKGSPLPVPEPVLASNGLVYKSNDKHTRGVFGNRPNAGLEPRNSLGLFESSVSPEEGGKHRYAKDENGNVHRFSDGNDGKWHWTGSTADRDNSLNKSAIPIDVKRKLGLSGKWG